MDRGRERKIEGWCILRTSGARTLRLADSLNYVGMSSWTPKRTFKRVRPGKKLDLNGQRLTMEVDAPILPTFVFARAIFLRDLEAAAGDPSSQHPAFSVFRHAGRIPIVADRDVLGLQDAERAAADAIQAQREAETREEADRIRIAAMRSRQAQLRALKAAEHEQRKMLRSERRDFSSGERVKVEEMPSLIGMTGIVESSDGRTALVRLGGSLIMKIETWQLSRDSVHAENIAA